MRADNEDQQDILLLYGAKFICRSDIMIYIFAKFEGTIILGHHS
jgi:hypothetical protein